MLREILRRHLSKCTVIRCKTSYLVDNEFDLQTGNLPVMHRENNHPYTMVQRAKNVAMIDEQEENISVSKDVD